MPIDDYPATVDFQGPSGLSFIRQAMLRYSFDATPNLKIDVALENSEFSGRGRIDDGMGGFVTQAEVSWVERELANGRSADATRLQTSVQFNF